MRAWIILAAMFIMTAIRPELEQPHKMSKAQFIVMTLALFGGLCLDILELADRMKRK